MAHCKHCGASHDMTGKSPGEPVLCDCGAMVFAEETAAQPAPAPKSAPVLKCPRCSAQLDLHNDRLSKAYDCSTCGGVWLGVDAFNAICMENAANCGHVFQNAGPKRMLLPEDKTHYLPCPTCRDLMNRRNFAVASGVIIDICARHGVWLDKDELSRIVAFIDAGGMRNHPDALINASAKIALPSVSQIPKAAPSHASVPSTALETVGAIAQVGLTVLDILTLFA